MQPSSVQTVLEPHKLPFQKRIALKFIQEVKRAVAILKQDGFKALFKCYGWKVIAVVICYYLIRDITLYIVIPLVILKMF